MIDPDRDRNSSLLQPACGDSLRSQSVVYASLDLEWAHFELALCMWIRISIDNHIDLLCHEVWSVTHLRLDLQSRISNASK